MSPHNSLLDISHNHSQRISRVLTVHFHAYSTYAYYITAQFGYWRSVHGHLHMKGLDLVWMCHSEVYSWPSFIQPVSKSILQLIMKNLLCLFFLCLFVGKSSAQILGESSEMVPKDDASEPIVLRSFEVGGSQARFTPSASNYGAIKYFLHRPLLSFLLRQDNSLLFFDYSNRKVDDAEVGLIAFGAKFDFEFLLTDYRNRFKPMIALSIIADLIQADRRGNVERDNPRLTSLCIGGGGGFNSSSRDMIFVIKAEVYVGFGTQGFSAVTGTARGFLIDAALQFPKLFGAYGIAFSYRLRQTISDYSENQYDYLFNIHSFTAGIAF